MAHDHDHFHSHEELNSYLVQQIFTIAICGAIGAVAVSLYVQGKLVLMLAAPFHKWVLAGGIALLVLVMVRALAVWRMVGQLAPVQVHEQAHPHAHEHHHDHGCCGHNHDHDHVHAPASLAVTSAAAGGTSLNVLPSPPLPLPAPAGEDHHHHDHDHDHGCCGHHHAHEHPSPAPAGNGHHDHGHDHDHGWAPWRYVLLLLPVVLFFLNLPNTGFSNAHGKAVDLTKIDFPGQNSQGGADGDIDFDVGFMELENAAMRQDTREAINGKTVRLVGQYVNIDDQHFTLVRYKMNCCAADALPLKSVIFIDSSQLKDPKQGKLNAKTYRNQWVEVTGRVQFLNQRGTGNFVTALVITPTAEKPLPELVKMTNQPANPYVN